MGYFTSDFERSVTGSETIGLILETMDCIENYRVANLIGSGYHDYSPYFAVYYRNPVGLESYYTYQEASAAKAGDLSIQNFTNQFTLDRTDVSSLSSRHPTRCATSTTAHFRKLVFGEWIGRPAHAEFFFHAHRHRLEALRAADGGGV